MLFSAIFLFFLPIVIAWPEYVPPVPACPQGWGHRDRKCYLLVEKSVDWDSAEKDCQSKGGHLTKDKGPNHHAFLQTAFTKDSKVWFGRYVDANSTEHWLDGSPINWDPVKTSKVSARKEQKEERQCGYLEYDAKLKPLLWNEQRCSKADGITGYICAKDVDPRSGNWTECVYPPQTKCGHVPDGFEKFDEKTYFKVITDDLHSEDAEETCKKIGGELASLHSKKEQDFVYKFLDNNEPGNDPTGYYIGVKFDKPHADNGKLAYNIDKTPLDYTAWGKGEPNDIGGRENCVEVRKVTGDTTGVFDNAWNDIPCDGCRRGVVCKFKCDA